MGESPWKPMATAPHDGTPILLKQRPLRKTDWPVIVAKWHQPANPTAEGSWLGQRPVGDPIGWMDVPE